MAVRENDQRLTEHEQKKLQTNEKRDSSKNRKIIR